MAKKRLFLLDGMALIYRAHFALIRSPIYTSRGFNSSAIYGFANTLLEIMEKRKPTHIAVAFDTSAPTPRHDVFPAYKAQRAEMPEELSAALPHVKRLLEAFNIPVLTMDGYEADDIIGTLARRADAAGDFHTWMVTPDKDFAQLVTETTCILKPGRQGNEAEVLGLEEIREQWQVQSPEQVIDILALWGDTSDNIPGIPGIGEKTAKKLIAEHGSVEGLIAAADRLKGKLKENVIAHAEQARLSRKLVCIIEDVPVDLALNDLVLRERDDTAVQSLFVQFEFNSLGKRLYGRDFQAGRGHIRTLGRDDSAEEMLIPDLKTMEELDKSYHCVDSPDKRRALIAALEKRKSFCLHTVTSEPNPRAAQVTGLAFSWKDHSGHFVPLPKDRKQLLAVLEEFRPVLEREGVEKIGHDLKADLTVLLWHGLSVQGPFFDVMLANTLISPDQKHTMDYMAEALLGYTRKSAAQAVAVKEQEGGQMTMLGMMDQQMEDDSDRAAENVDIICQLANLLRPMLAEQGQERVFHEVESPLTPVLAAMEVEGVTIDTNALADISVQLGNQIADLETRIYQQAGEPFNLNSPRQLGEVMVDRLQLIEKPKKTKTGQYKMDEQVLSALALRHQIAADLLAYREASKLKSTYVDALPHSVLKRSGRVHTRFDQLMTATGRLASNDPNLQNIPIRTEQGREIRKAFVPRGPEFRILSADYSQIELRVMASLSGDPAMIEAFQSDLDIHTATAARVYNVDLDQVLPEMRRTAKMVNFGIIYGITGFGLAQRLGIPKGDANVIIEEYFRQYGGVKEFMDSTVVFAQDCGYVETMTGRRRYLREINSRNWNLRQAAERTAINTPVQGSAADMIKLAMVAIFRELRRQKLQSRMILQVHDELVFDLHVDEEPELREIVTRCMKNALPLKVPIVVETGVGENWLQAH